LNKVWLLN